LAGCGGSLRRGEGDLSGNAGAFLPELSQVSQPSNVLSHQEDSFLQGNSRVAVFSLSSIRGGDKNVAVFGQVVGKKKPQKDN
jgi:hypothetical protein